MKRRKALILSGGGLFGAWQVGAWAALERHFQPDVIVGCSIGSLNGWAIAGGCKAAELAEWWRRAAREGRLHWKFPRSPLDGLVDSRQVEQWIHELHAAFTPAIEYYAVMTDLLRLKPRLVEGRQATWKHLAASCALFGVLPQRRVGGRIYTDGGMLSALPMWAARDIKATFSVGLNVMPKVPWPVRATLTPIRALRGLAGATGGNDIILAPSASLGSWRHSALFDPGRIDRWIEQGREDTERALPRILAA